MNIFKRFLLIIILILAIATAESTQYIIIKGGNHAQFGWYGDQAGDNPAAISEEINSPRSSPPRSGCLREFSERIT